MYKVQYTLVFLKFFLGLKHVNFFESDVFWVLFKILIISTQHTIFEFSKMIITKPSVFRSPSVFLDAVRTVKPFTVFWYCCGVFFNFFLLFFFNT